MCVENLSGWTEFTFRWKLSSGFGCNQQLIDGVVYTSPEGCANWQREWLMEGWYVVDAKRGTILMYFFEVDVICKPDGRRAAGWKFTADSII